MKKINKTISIFLTAVMLFALIPFGVMADTAEGSTITVTFSAQEGGAFLLTRRELEVTDGLAEEYGYTVSENDHNGVKVDAPTVFDALVAAHKAKYGDAFTAETASDYLAVSGGWISKAFGSTDYSSVFVNGKMPADENKVGYMADAARLKENDNVEFWFIQDTDFWADFYTYFTESEKTVAVNEKFTLNLKGYCATYDTVPQSINGASGYVTLNTVEEDGFLSAALTDSDGNDILIDADGSAELSFDKAGEYIVTASGFAAYEFYGIEIDAPIVAPWCRVIVCEESADEQESFNVVSDKGVWYPEFSSNYYWYTIVVPAGENSCTITYSCPKNTAVKLGGKEQIPNENGEYTFELRDTEQILSLTSSDGKVSEYSFSLQTQKTGCPDKITDYLCINSQYTNKPYGISPQETLSGSFVTPVSLGNFGGYIVYYYENGIRNDPKNKYGVDFYVYGNALAGSEMTKTSSFEPAQAWVSEDGAAWYALAGSAHYDDGVDWNYSVDYVKTDDGKTAWTDSHGNSNSGSAYAGEYPDSSIYNLNKLAASDKITLSGVMLPAENGDAAVLGISTNAYPVRWGYADCFAGGVIGEDIDPYIDNTDFNLQTNGFDLEWAVDENGIPQDVTDKEFHYIKLQTASNIWHPSFGEKSSEIYGMVRTTAQKEPVGRSAAPESITITDGADKKTVPLTEDNVYCVDVGSMKYVSLSVNGADSSDNIYVNNQRITAGGSAGTFKVTKGSGEKLIRLIIQNGDKEPRIYLFKLTGTADDTNDIIESVKINASGIVRAADTVNGEEYKAAVGYRINSVSIVPVADPSAEILVNGEAIKNEYALNSGENIFTITGKKGDITHTVTLKITRESAPVSTGKIRVYFSLLGDVSHGENGEVHTLKGGGLTEWIPRTAYEINTPATVLDVLEEALSGKFTFVNADGNYISQIGDLAELSNGARSGWMYTLNGGRPTKGIAEQSVKSGDVIVFHYSDDHTLEKGSENISSGKSPSKSNNVSNKKTEDSDKNRFENNNIVDTSFADISGHWAEDAIKFVVSKKLFAGVSDNSFEPETHMTRAMLVTVLWRLDGMQKVNRQEIFADVNEDTYYSEAVAWASANGIVSGYGNDIFGADNDVTREQLAAILHRYAEYKQYEVNNSGELDIFTDAGEISDFAVNSMKWAVGAGIISGRTATAVVPRGSSTRAEVAAMISRFAESFVK